jgi:hypothetical protein
MVDREARDTAAELVRRYCNDQLTYREFYGAWPKGRSEDRAMRAVAGALQEACESSSAGAMVESLQRSPEGLEHITRGWLFLRSDLEYAWPGSDEANPILRSGCAALVLGVVALGWSIRHGWLLTVGLVLTALGVGLLIPGGLIENREARRSRAAGDESVWPFMRREDYEAALEGALGSLPLVVLAPCEPPGPPETIWEAGYPLPFLLFAILFPLVPLITDDWWLLLLWPVLSVAMPLAWGLWCARREGRTLSWRRRRRGTKEAR